MSNNNSNKQRKTTATATMTTTTTTNVHKVFQENNLLDENILSLHILSFLSNIQLIQKKAVSTQWRDLCQDVLDSRTNSQRFRWNKTVAQTCGLRASFESATLKTNGWMTLTGYGFNWSMQHLISDHREEDVAGEVSNADIQQGKPEGADVGSLAARRFTACHRVSIWSRAFLDSAHSSGGSRLRLPHRKRSRLALTLSEREEISRAVVAELSLCSIAASFGKAPRQWV